MSTADLLFASALQRIGCTLEPGAHDERREALQSLFAQAQERQNLADGVRYRFAGDDATLAALFGMIAAERTCCSSLRLTLQAEPQSGPLWLEITGPAEAVAALQQVFSAWQDTMDSSFTPPVRAKKRDRAGWALTQPDSCADVHGHGDHSTACHDIRAHALFQCVDVDLVRRGDAFCQNEGKQAAQHHRALRVGAEVRASPEQARGLQFRRGQPGSAIRGKQLQAHPGIGASGVKGIHHPSKHVRIQR